MSALIKSHGGTPDAKIRAFGAPQPLRPEFVAKVDPQLTAARAEIADLQLRLAELESAVKEHGPALEAAYAKGETAGHEAGLKEAGDHRADLNSKIAASAEGALQKLAGEFASLERLAPVLAVEALEKIVGDPESRADLVRQIVRAQLKALEAQAVIHVEVSKADFDEEGAAELGATLGGAATVLCSDDLKSGDCRIKLRLGELDAGLDQQWGRLRKQLIALTERVSA